MTRILFAFTVLCALAAPVLAVEPDEVLDDPVLEQRARDLSGELRCLVCQNQAIDDSDAELAKDLRVLVRERLVAGDTNREVLDFIVARYGEYVLLNPRVGWHTLALWMAAPLILILGAVIVFLRLRRPATEATDAAELTPEERDALQSLSDRPGNPER